MAFVVVRRSTWPLLWLGGAHGLCCGEEGHMAFVVVRRSTWPLLW